MGAVSQPVIDRLSTMHSTFLSKDAGYLSVDSKQCIERRIGSRPATGGVVSQPIMDRVSTMHSTFLSKDAGYLSNDSKQCIERRNLERMSYPYLVNYVAADSFACLDCTREKRLCIIKTKNDTMPVLRPLGPAVRPDHAQPDELAYYVMGDMWSMPASIRGPWTLLQYSSTYSSSQHGLRAHRESTKLDQGWQRVECQVGHRKGRGSTIC